MKKLYILVSVYIIFSMFINSSGYAAFWDDWNKKTTQVNAQTPPVQTSSSSDEVTNVQTLLNQANQLIKEGEFDRAEDLAEKAKELLPNDPRTQRVLIEIYTAKGESQKAKNLLRETIVKPQFSDLVFWATRKYYDFFEGPGGVETGIQELKAANVNNVNVKKAIAEGYARLRDWGQVIDLYEEILASNPQDYLIADRLANYYIMNRDYSAAINILEQLTQNNPDNNSYLNSLLDAYTKGGQREQALTLYRQQIARKPNSAGLTGRYAEALMGFGQLEQALAQWERADQLDPTNLYFKQRRGETALQMGNYPYAEKQFNELLRAATQQKNERVKKMATEYLKTIADLKK
ncbi:MAG: tetratricopeptide repeat protein [Candidatus Omnitrophica bacterium]|nr:tetratricopeptide repeat protein [Candidatus Omnitrophota bacterium]